VCCEGSKSRPRISWHQSQNSSSARLGGNTPARGAFRELLQTNPSIGKQFWIVDLREAFKRTADELYRALTNNLAGTAPIASLGSDPAY
jgi:hypothetical protein